MAVGGPNSRKDFHHDPGEELFLQLEGDIVLRIAQNGRITDMPIREGDLFMLPPEIPRPPQRPAGTVGIVVERAAARMNSTVFFLVLRKTAEISLYLERNCRGQHRDRTAGRFRAFLFERLTPHLRRLRHGHGSAHLRHPELNAGTAAAHGRTRPRKAPFAAEFHHPFDSDGRKVVYLAGHSLGPQAKSTARYVEEELADWRRLEVLGHHEAKRPLDRLSRSDRRTARATGWRG